MNTYQPLVLVDRNEDLPSTACLMPFHVVERKSGVTKAVILTTFVALAIVGQEMSDLGNQTSLEFGKRHFQSIAINPTWITKDASNWLNSNVVGSSDGLHRLKCLIGNVFGKVAVNAELYQDPDESWSKVLLTIGSNLGDNFEMQIALENVLFEQIWASEELRELAKSMIITQS
jgi:hypothetical protein